jgi:hypothetical protein
MYLTIIEHHVLVKYVSGTCSSPLARIKVAVVDKPFFTIPNASTPNGDGLNDYIKAKAEGHVDLMYFRK